MHNHTSLIIDNRGRGAPALENKVADYADLSNDWGHTWLLPGDIDPHGKTQRLGLSSGDPNWGSHQPRGTQTGAVTRGVQIGAVTRGPKLGSHQGVQTGTVNKPKEPKLGYNQGVQTGAVTTGPNWAVTRGSKLGL